MLKLSPEGYIVEALLFMTGREDRLTKEPVLDEMQLQCVKAIVPLLQTGAEAAARCDLLNRLLLTLGIKTISRDFVETVFADVEMNASTAVRAAVERFRIVCMLEFGSFRHGFRQFRHGATIRAAWRKYFPTPQGHSGSGEDDAGPAQAGRH